VGEIDGNIIKDAHSNKIAEVENGEIKDAHLNKIWTVDGVQNIIDGTGGLTSAALWVLLLR
jgi:pyridoxal/pyridoxine/pyridoxamine kinase